MRKIKLNRCRPAQYLYRNLQATFFVVHLLYNTAEVVKRPIDDANHFTRFVHWDDVGMVKSRGRLAFVASYGLPVGADLEYADEATVSRAMQGRREL